MRAAVSRYLCIGCQYYAYVGVHGMNDYIVARPRSLAFIFTVYSVTFRSSPVSKSLTYMNLWLHRILCTLLVCAYMASAC